MASLTEEDMTLIQEVIKLMSPLKVVTTLLSEEKKKHHLTIHDGHYTYLQDLLHYSSALEPRFKDLVFLDDSDTKDMIFMKLTAEVVKMDEKVRIYSEYCS